MARRGLLASITSTSPTEMSEEMEHAPAASASFHNRGAPGAIRRSISDIAARAEQADAIEARLTAGQAVIEIDPSSVDPSFMADRFGSDDEEFRALLKGIDERGQDSPILVRPSPTSPGRYQVAFGHRRLLAAQRLGRPVRAVVKVLSDRDVILAQGQENSARANLSFIERAFFVHRLDHGGYDRETIMKALSIDKSILSTMITVATALPRPLIDAIGPAPSIGRPRWVELADAIKAVPDFSRMVEVTSSEEFSAASSDERFSIVLAHAKRASAIPTTKPQLLTKPLFWSSSTGAKIARIQRNPKETILAIDKRKAPGFADYIVAQLDHLFADFSQQPKEG